MSYFTLEASKKLCAAEDALLGRRPPALPPAPPCGDGAAVLELQRQLRVAIAQIGQLRAELSAEREGRSQTLVSLGRRWREEVMVELRAASLEARRDVAELRALVDERQAQDAAARAVLRRQIEGAVRAAKVRDRAQFDDSERAAAELAELRTRVDDAARESAAGRAEGVQQLERERTALAAQLDAELARFADMRREGERARDESRAELLRERGAQERRVEALVGAAWQRQNEALEQSLRKEATEARRESRRAAEVADNAMTVAGEAHATARATAAAAAAASSSSYSRSGGLCDRVDECMAALETQCAALTQRAESAQRKADDAGDIAKRAEIVSQSARDAVERAESAWIEREARCKEAASDALRTAMEHCDRFAGRAEQRAAITAERVEACARETAQCHAASNRAEEETAAVRKRIAAVESELRTVAEDAAQWKSHAIQEADTRMKDAYATTAGNVAELQQSLEAHAQYVEELRAQLQQAREWQAQCEARVSEVDTREALRIAKVSDEAVRALEARLAAEGKRMDDEAVERGAAVQQAERRVEALSAALRVLAQRVEDYAQERALVREVEDIRHTVDALDAKLRAASGNAVEWQRMVDEEIAPKLRSLETEQRRQRHLVDHIQDEVRETREAHEARKVAWTAPSEIAGPFRDKQESIWSSETQEPKGTGEAREISEVTEDRSAPATREPGEVQDVSEAKAADAAWATPPRRAPATHSWGNISAFTPESTRENVNSPTTEDEAPRESADAVPDAVAISNASEPHKEEEVEEEEHKEEEVEEEDHKEEEVEEEEHKEEEVEEEDHKEEEVEEEEHKEEEHKEDGHKEAGGAAPRAAALPASAAPLRWLSMQPYPESSSSTAPSADQPTRRGARRMQGVAVDDSDEAEAPAPKPPRNAWYSSWDDDTTSEEPVAATAEEERPVAERPPVEKAWGFAEEEKEKREESYGSEAASGANAHLREPFAVTVARSSGEVVEEVSRQGTATTASSLGGLDTKEPLTQAAKGGYTTFDDTTSEDEV